jgi:hypothetical protein
MTLKSLPRTVAAVLAIAALAAPVATARPIARPASEQTNPSERTQDLRHLRAGADIRTSSLAGTTDAQPVDTDDGTPWMPIGIAVTGLCLLVAVTVALTRRPHARRARATA